MGFPGLVNNVGYVIPQPLDALDLVVYDQTFEIGSALRQSKVDRIPRGHIGRPADVANAVGFFMQAESEFVTGQNLFVCGGASLGSSSFL